jgi:hypothetical protein
MKIFYILFFISNIFALSYEFKDVSSNGYSLTINTIPYNSKVVIKDYQYRYYDGIELPKGDYKIEISKTGYKTKIGKIYIDKHTTLNITLTKKPTTNIHTQNRSVNIWFDKDTNLTWQNTKNSNKYTYEEAKDYCEELSIDGYTNWRLPSIDELHTLITDRRYKDSNGYKHFIKQDLINSMPNRKSSFWSISNYEDFDTKAIVFRFYLGNNKPERKNKVNYVKCVW